MLAGGYAVPGVIALSRQALTVSGYGAGCGRYVAAEAAVRSFGIRCSVIAETCGARLRAIVSAASGLTIQRSRLRRRRDSDGPRASPQSTVEGECALSGLGGAALIAVIGTTCDPT